MDPVKRSASRGRTRAGTLLAAGLAALLGGCGAPEEPLRVGTNEWVGYQPLFLARSLGLLDDSEVRLVAFPSAREVLRAYRFGALDVAALTADEALLLAETVPGQRVFLVCDFSRGADAILGRPGIGSLADLRGRRVGLEQNALGAYLLARALELEGMTAGEVAAVPVPLLEHESALAQGRVDAIVTFDPVRSRLLAAGASVLFDSSRIPGEIVDVLLASPATVETRRRSVQALVDAWFGALDELRLRPDRSARLLAPRQRVSPEAVRASLAGLELPDRATNARLLGRSGDSLEGPLRRLSGTMVRHRLLARPAAEGIVLDDRFVRTGGR